MSYIRKVISNEEKLLSIFRPHWIYPFEGLLWFVFLTVIGFALDFYLYQYFGLHAIRFRVDLWLIQFDEKNTPIPWAFMFCGFAVFWPLFLAYISTEIGLTNQRIVHKKGLIFIQIDQVDLDDIRAEHVFHGFLGWLLGYGRIRLDCRFIDDIWLPAIRDPYRLVKASHTARMKHPGIDYDADMLQTNLQQIDKRREEAQARQKIINFKEAVKRSFRRAA